MKRIILTLTLALSLAGCASIQKIQTAIKIGTASISNPVTKERLYQMESAVSLVFVGLNTWKKACTSGLIPSTCKDQIRTVQVYTVQMPPYLRQLRAFVRENNQVNATVVFNTLSDLLGEVRTQAAAAGQNLGS